ncbi:SAM-dependent methyltransferase [Leuconostocaceae bacterium ESL0723]|nr:SAM-dependent methyltransferase [Leuconostocaceae bacterium ESL0723]
MLFSTNQFVHQMIEAQVQPGDWVADATGLNGINTNFLASRVGPTGQVLAYLSDRDQANQAVSGLFMSGLNDRVTIYQHDVSQLGQTDLDPNQALSLIIFDYSSDTGGQALYTDDSYSKILATLPYLNHGGLLIVKFDTVPDSWQSSFDRLRPLDYRRAFYRSGEVSAFLVERI